MTDHNPGPEVRERLERIDAEQTQARWHIAAIVVAFIGREDSPENPHTAASLAALGVHGLPTVAAVEHYRAGWFSVYDWVPQPGDTVTLPDIAFPEPDEIEGAGS